MTTLPEHPRTDEPPPAHSRRRFLTYLVAAPTLAVAAQVVADVAGPATAQALPSLPAPAELLDLGDVLILAGKPTEDLVVVTVDERGRVGLALPRAEVGQGITTAVAMLLADELDVPLDRVDVTLADARPELVFNQLTGGSNTMRSVYGPVRRAAAVARARLLAAAALRWGTTPGSLTVVDGVVSGPGGRTATYGELSAVAADRTLTVAPAALKPASAQRVVGTPTSRTDARAMVTGQQRYTLDLDVVPGALPTMLRRPPTINGAVRSLDNEAEVRAMPGVVDVAVVPTGVAVLAETFGQARDAVAAVRATWGPGTVDGEDDESIRRKLRAVTPPPAPGLLVRTVDAEFDFAFVSHAPLEPNCAIAHVTADRAEIWSPLKSPIVAQETIAAELGLPVSRVTVHVVQGGGSFGRRLFSDAALEAARVSKATGRPVKLLWSRIDDMRHGRARAASHHRIRATHAAGDVLTFEHRVASVETDFGHGLGEILTSVAASLPVGGNASFAQTVFLTTVHSPYHFGVTTQTLAEVPLRMHTGSWRSVYSANTRGAEEVVVDELAAATGRDPAEFRRRFLKEDRYRTVLDTVVHEGQWGRRMPRGRAQGLGFHAEYKGCTACLVEIDARDPQRPRVIRATIAVDVGKAVNPRGLEAQMLGGLTDAIGTTLRAGLHLVDGLPLEGSYSQFHYTRQADSPPDVRVFVIDSSDEPGGAGELGVPAAVGAVANAYARATGTRPRSFPLVFPVDFEPFPR
ncbi:molybdopterin cofactor-binding domain-containing protein [Geodermatophilus sp. SYSU D00698]